MSLHFLIIFYFMLFQIPILLISMISMPSFIREIFHKMIKTNAYKNIRIAYYFLIAFVFLFFVESIRTTYEANQSYLEFKEKQTGKEPEHEHEHHHHYHDNTFAMEKANLLSKKFFFERNLYLTGSTLLLSFMIVVFLSKNKEVIELEDEIEKIEKIEKAK